jgi:hypothetical protein
VVRREHGCVVRQRTYAVGGSGKEVACVGCHQKPTFSVVSQRSSIGETASALPNTTLPQAFRQHSRALRGPPTPAPMTVTLMPLRAQRSTPSTVVWLERLLFAVVLFIAYGISCLPLEIDKDLDMFVSMSSIACKSLSIISC